MDGFCGAGGSTTGVKQAIARVPAWAGGIEVRIAINHWELAIRSHAANHPEVDHYQTDLHQADPWRFPRCRVGVFSPECDDHTIAKGHRLRTMERAAQRQMFAEEPLDPAAERSRMLMFDVPRFAEWHRFDLVLVENVVEARRWVLYPAWLQAMQLLGYEYREVFWNSQFTGVPQSRDRLYVVFWRKGMRAPDLDLRPPAYCPRCATNVDAVQAWKDPRRPWGKYGPYGQYLYVCPGCGQAVRPYYWAAANIIDWAQPGERIGDRKHPLKPKTLERVRHGLARFSGPQPFILLTNASLPQQKLRAVLDTLPTQTSSVPPCLISLPFVVPLDYTHAHGAGQRATSALEPLRTQTGAQVQALVVPPGLLDLHEGQQGMTARCVLDPLATQTSTPTLALVIPTGHTQAGADGRGGSVLDPLPVQTSRQEQAVVQPYLVTLRGTATGSRSDAPLPTLTGGSNHEAVVVPQPFLLSYYGTEVLRPVLAALGTQSVLDRHALVAPTAAVAVEDCHFRILSPQEVKQGMGFADSYILQGTGRQQVELAGQAVCPPTMAELFGRCLAILQ